MNSKGHLHANTEKQNRIINSIAQGIPYRTIAKIENRDKATICNVKKKNLDKIQRIKQELGNLALKVSKKAFEKALSKKLKKDSFHSLVSAGREAVYTETMLTGGLTGLNYNENKILIILNSQEEMKKYKERKGIIDENKT